MLTNQKEIIARKKGRIRMESIAFIEILLKSFHLGNWKFNFPKEFLLSHILA